jgi:hypothetical protein
LRRIAFKIALAQYILTFCSWVRALWLGIGSSRLELGPGRFSALGELLRPRTEHKRHNSDSPCLSWHGLAWHGLAWPCLAWPGLASHCFASPLDAPPRVSSPRVASSHLSFPSLFLVCPCLASPRLALPSLDAFLLGGDCHGRSIGKHD